MAKRDKEIVKLKLSDVEASLSKGRLNSENIWVITCSALLFLSFILIVGCIIASVTTKDIEDLTFCLIMGGLGVIVFLASFFLLVVNERYKNKVKEWMKDSVIIEANCTSIASAPVARFPALILEAKAIEVSFIYDNNLLVRRSEIKGKPVYLKVFNKYADRKIIIAYSPHYDEVMLLKMK